MTSPPDRSNAMPPMRAEDNIGVQLGSRNSQYFYGVGAGPAWPVREGGVPIAADYYQNRQAAVAVEDGLDEAGTVVLVPAATTIVAGMGGVGKTQIAAHHVRPLWNDSTVDLALWVTATDRNAILSGYARTAHAIGQATDDDPAMAATALLNWLATTKRRWVIVVDDLQDPDHMSGLWPPHSDTGHTVVTTRRRDAVLRRGDRKIVEVTPYTYPESLSYLNAIFADYPMLLDGATALAEELHHLPLALAQAVAYMIDAEITCAEYTKEFRIGRNVAPDRLPDDHQHTIDRTWKLSITLADQLTPKGLARPLLELLSLLDPNGIPSDLITSAPVVSYLADRAGHRTTPDDAKRAARCLHRLSLANVDTAHPQRAVRVHGLVQRTTRAETSDVNEPAIAIAAADALVTLWPDIEPDNELMQSLRTNTAALEHHAHTHLWHPDAHALLFKHGKSLGNAGLVASARIHFEQLRETAIKKLGKEHPDTLTARAGVARWQGEGGDVAGALAECEQLLADRVRVLGAEHPDTLATRHDLAWWRAEVGDVAGAVVEFGRLLTDRVRVLDADHPDTLVTRADLAYWRGVGGDMAGALAEFERLLADYLRVLGAEHPDTLTARADLARWRGASGDVAGALAECEQLLIDRVRVLGADHPKTLSARAHVTYWRGEGGDVAGALAGDEQLLADYLRVLGADHQHTLATRHTLAYGRAVGGDVAGALAEFERLLADRVRVLGAEQRDTLATRHDLAYWRGVGGDVAGALAEFERLLADRVRVLGEDHPDTLATRANREYWRESSSGAQSERPLTE